MAVEPASAGVMMAAGARLFTGGFREGIIVSRA